MLKFNDYLKEAALSAKQKKIAAVAGDKDKIDAADLAALRAGKKPVEEAGCYGKDMKKSVKEETEELDEGKMKELSMDVDDMDDKDFHKKYGNPKHHYTNKPPFDPDPKPAGKVTPGKYGQGPSQAKHLAKKGLASLTKEEAEDIEEASTITGKIVKGIARVGNELKDAGKGTAELGGQGLGAVAKTIGAIAALPGATKAAYQQGKANTYKSVAEETVAEENHMMAYVNATLAVMDEGKIDNLRDTQALRAANKSAYDKDYKADDSHPHITLNKGTAYGGSNQKDDEGDEKPDNEKQEKRGRGRPSGSKSGARQKGAGKDNSIDGREYHLHLPK